MINNLFKYFSGLCFIVNESETIQIYRREKNLDSRRFKEEYDVQIKNLITFGIFNSININKH